MNNEDLVRQFLGVVEANTSKFPHVADKVKRLIHTGKWDALSEYTRDLNFPTPIPASDLKSVIDPHNAITAVVAFKNRVIDDPLLRQKVLSSVKEGDWEGISKVAALEGLTVSVEELKQGVPPAFFNGPS